MIYPASEHREVRSVAALLGHLLELNPNRQRLDILCSPQVIPLATGSEAYVCSHKVIRTASTKHWQARHNTCQCCSGISQSPTHHHHWQLKARLGIGGIVFVPISYYFLSSLALIRKVATAIYRPLVLAEAGREAYGVRCTSHSRVKQERYSVPRTVNGCRLDFSVNGV